MNSLCKCRTLVVLLLVCSQLARYESINVSPKLDFVDSSEDTLAKGKPSAPKIHGVRVVVDTGKIKKSIESKSVEDDDDTEDDNEDESSNDSMNNRSKNAKKTVGIRTDVTIEISDEDGTADHSNNTRKNRNKNGAHDGVKVDDKLDDDDDDDDVANKGRRVPVITGSATGGGAKIPNDNVYGSLGPEPKWQLHNVPVLFGTNNVPTPNTGDRRDNRVPPVSGWTTEPNYYLHHNNNPNINAPRFKPQRPASSNWKPCRCHPSVVPINNNNNWKPNQLRPRTLVVPQYPPFKSHHRVDDKLEYPFSSSQSDEY